MPTRRHLSCINTAELKAQLFKKIGPEKAIKYSCYLTSLLALKISKAEFNRLCVATIGRQNVALHNLLIRSIINNAFLSGSPPAIRANTGDSQISEISGGSLGVSLPTSPRRGRTMNSRGRKFTDRLSRLGPHGKTQGIQQNNSGPNEKVFSRSVQEENNSGLHGKMLSASVQEVTNSCILLRPREQQHVQEKVPVGNKVLLEVGSVETGEEVEQQKNSPGVQSRSPLRPPFGIPVFVGGVSRKSLCGANGFQQPDNSESCYKFSELPDTRSLTKRLESKLAREGLDCSMGCVNVLNNGLDAYLKRLIKPCMELARARCTDKKMYVVSETLAQGVNGMSTRENGHISNQYCSASLLDFQVAMELNPRLLGENSSVQLEKICLRTLKD